MSFFKNLRSFIVHPFIAGPLGGLLIVLLAYLDSKYKNQEKENETYVYLFLVSSLVFSTIIYFISGEFNNTDEFLNQDYDTSTPSFLPKSKGGFREKIMKGPDNKYLDMFNTE